MKGKSSPRALNRKRKTVLNALKAQLKAGTKTEKGSLLTLATTGLQQIPLTEPDQKRIGKEIATLENLIVSDAVAAGTRTKKMASERRRRGSYS